MRVVLALLGLLAAMPVEAGEMRRLVVNGVERTYYLHVPSTVKPGAPLVIMLHGATANGRNDVHRYGWHHMAESHDFVVAGPDAPTLRADQPESNENFRTWNHGGHRGAGNVTMSDDVGFIAAMIDDIARQSAIDRRRVHVAGFSSGGSMAHRLGIELAGRIASISASAGGLPPTYGRPARGMPILISAGDRDPVTPVEGKGTFIADSHRAIIDKWRALDGCPASRRLPSAPDLLIELSAPCRDGSEVRYVLMIGVEHVWPRTSQIDLTEASWQFFKRFRLPK
ncbi:MAG: alpha/beta fold hydrolase [Alphaproteobacteria bacterium]|nr:alpha/beta fold hydrolase [Alphaproteobacteria bacterium]MCW5739070.1 alpha/beta fold hydrolase [Alphaproteobacteria bacterium]